MNLADYFADVEGIGVLGTADSEGQVDLALYARPHVVADDAVAFIMADRLSHDNVGANPHAAYLFVERGQGYKGLRLYLTRTREGTDPEKIEAMRRRVRDDPQGGDAPKFLVYFKVDRVRRLTGD
jgi:hypothetical protein